MTEMGGYRDRVAQVDLGDGEVSYRGIDDDDAEKYSGARGLGVKYVFDKGADVDPLGPENRLAFMTGPLTGTQTVMSGRIALVTKSPL
ncbi:aldehyde ferredoxin oxidoreductase N-terminal domain-containing protein, partial [Halorubrum sp. AD140]|uniref:aldehyde ferredoxin oxidoreductase N-terminal domain-containing protein n=1 Tax=Halorubrum sp. AD140 TaxID=3050073 RepID=UPI002ACCED17